MRITPQFTLSANYQHVNNPAYNIATLNVDAPNYFMADRSLLTDFFTSRTSCSIWCSR